VSEGLCPKCQRLIIIKNGRCRTCGEYVKEIPAEIIEDTLND